MEHTKTYLDYKKTPISMRRLRNRRSVTIRVKYLSIEVETD